MKHLLFLLFFFVTIESYSQRIICHPMGSQEECVLAYAAFREFVDDTNVIIIFNPISMV